MEEDKHENVVVNGDSKDLVSEEDNITEKPGVQENLKKPKKTKTLIMVLITLLFLAAGGIYFVLSKNNKPSVKPATNTSSVATKKETKSLQPENVAYAFRNKDDEPFVIYTRPAIGGERAESKKLPANEFTVNSDVHGANAAFATTKDVYLSTDSGKSYEQIFIGNTNDQVTSLQISKDGTSLAYAVLSGSEPTVNTVKSYDIASKASKDLFTGEKAGIFIFGWNSKENKIIYSSGCYGCDGNRTSPVLRELGNNTVKQLYDTEKSSVVSVVVSDDFKTMLYSTATEDQDLYPGLGGGGAPYTIRELTIADGSHKTLSTFGTKSEKKADGTNLFRSVRVGYTQSDNPVPYYTDGSSLFTFEGNSEKLLFSFDANTFIVDYVDKNNIIAGIGEYEKWTLNNYTIADKKSVKIFEGDKNTRFFGVTLK